MLNSGYFAIGHVISSAPSQSSSTHLCLLMSSHIATPSRHASLLFWIRKCSVRLATHLAKVCTDSDATGILESLPRRNPMKNVDPSRVPSKKKEGESWDDVMNDPKYTKIVASQSWKKEPECNFSDNGAIFFTSGTSVVSFMFNRKPVRLRPYV